ncbi:MAG TPA: metal-dependent transcriptional regulator [Candidatus Avisuccinivibrio pullicola]|nr:metal-dependent transcriptional regulator [Candidatus Avisuccinivibrio pullicola]
METNSKNAPTALNAVPEPVPLRSGIVAESGENYLETILVMKERNEAGLVRAVDVANELGFSKPSVSRALNQLKEKNLIRILDSGAILFTPEGQELAESIFERHQLLTVLLQHIADVPSNIAEHDACRIEHVISDETMAGIKVYLEEHGLL